MSENDRLPVYEAVVEEGDRLFVPSWWWHQPISVTRSRHLAVRTVHDDTFCHPLFRPEFHYRFFGKLKRFFDFREATDNSNLNYVTDIAKFYAEMGVSTEPFFSREPPGSKDDSSLPPETGGIHEMGE